MPAYTAVDYAEKVAVGHDRQFYRNTAALKRTIETGEWRQLLAAC